jgi:hypothetical protein
VHPPDLDGIIESNEAARHHLYNELGGVLSPESTSELMRLLPPVGWADVATKQDLAMLEHRLRAEISDSLRRQTVSLVGVMLTLFAIAWATVTFGG